MGIQKGNQKALIIAVSSYEHYEALDFCRSDGEAIYNLLSFLGYEIHDKNKLIGHVQGENMRDAIIDFFTDEKTGPDDTLLLYYSGHGIESFSGNVYLAPSDMIPSKPTKRGFSFDDLRSEIQESTSKKIVLILDCCHSGSAAISKGSKNKSSQLISTIEKDSRTIEEGEGTCILAASQEYQNAYSLDEEGHSIFTYYLLQGLKGNEDSVDNDGCVTPQSLNRYIFKKIRSLPLDKRPRQKPSMKSEVSGDIILAYYPLLSKRAKPEQITDSTATVIESEISKGEEYFVRGDLTGALDFYIELTERYPTNPTVWFERGRALNNLGRYEEAVSCLSISIAIDPKNPESWLGKGNSLYNLKRYDDSIECFNKELLLSPNDANIWYGKGINLQKKGKIEEALECYNKSISLDAKANLAYYSKGTILRDLGKDEEAFECFDKSTEINPGFSVPWNEKGLLLIKKGKFEQSIECLNKAIALDSTNDNFLSNKASALMSLQKHEEALECCNKAIDINPENVVTWTTKGRVLIKLQRYEEALECCNKTIELISKNYPAGEEKDRTLQTFKNIRNSLQGKKEHLSKTRR
jgi:tetratricopeptide (TPR) repeat protein